MADGANSADAAEAMDTDAVSFARPKKVARYRLSQDASKDGGVNPVDSKTLSGEDQLKPTTIAIADEGVESMKVQDKPNEEISNVDRAEPNDNSQPTLMQDEVDLEKEEDPLKDTAGDIIDDVGLGNGSVLPMDDKFEDNVDPLKDKIGLTKDDMGLLKDDVGPTNDEVGPNKMVKVLISNDPGDTSEVASKRKSVISKNSSRSSAATERKPEEIVILSDEDNEQDSKTNKCNVNCINLDCKSLSDVQLLEAPSYVSAFFGQKWRRRFKNSQPPPQVCEVCYELATIVHEEMTEALANDTSIFDVEFSASNETVVLSDSDTDEEVEDEDEYLPAGVVDFVQTNLKDVIEGCLGRYDLDLQLQKAEHSVVEAVESLTLDCKETLALQVETQLRLDRLRSDLYAHFAVRPRVLNPVEIIDHAGPVVAMNEVDAADTVALPKPGGVAMKRVTQGARRSPKHQATMSSDKNVVSVRSQIAAEASGEVVALEQVKVIHSQLPTCGPIARPKPKIGETVYAMRFSLFSVWARCTVIDVSVKYPPNLMPEVDHTAYKVRFEGKKPQTKLLTGRQVAYNYPPNVRLNVGTRVIAVFKVADTEAATDVESYYAGIVAEPPKQLNHYRYLIFFDDGYTQYVVHEKLRLVCEQSRHPSEDVHEDSKAFIKNYMAMYPERPMVKLGVGQNIKTEWNGKWWLARVIEVDASLCNMNFLADARTEWLYRGSTRLAPLYKELARSNPDVEPQTSATRHRSAGIATLKRANMPYVEYTLAAEADAEPEAEAEAGAEVEAVEEVEVVEKPSRAVAKKSTTKRPAVMQAIVPRTRQQHVMPAEGRIKFDVYNMADYALPLKFVPHQCGPPCVNRIPYYPDQMKHCGPLAVPLLLGWRRELVKYRGKKVVLYKAPCGRRLRKMDELARYLRFTKCNIGLDFFDCNFWVNCLSEFMIPRHLASIKDLSYTVEYMPVPCANTIDHLLPEYVAYTTKREPVESVNLNLDPEFLTGCDCKDGCQDRDKCACWQLTFAGTIFTSGKTGVPDNSIGYRFKRLTEPVLTGIYECNSRCQCSSTCSNRVVQNPLRSKLQVFRTANRGWGIRALNDMPQGSFICIYAGRLLNEHEANEGGKNYGDEYLAELDYIEVVERLKEGYEAQVEDIFGPQCGEDTTSSLGSNDTDRSKSVKRSEGESRDSDESFKPAASQDEDVEAEAETVGIKTRSFRKKKGKKFGKKSGKRFSLDEDSGSKDSDCMTVSDDEDLGKRRPQSFAPAAKLDPMDLEEERPLSFPSIRTFFEETDMCYIMDAKTSGNIGRYLNHSCNPNVFVQNVFVDTHDLRFPWVAFFALSYIQAGTELTWDYNYDIGSVKDKVLYCKCGSADCRGRLL